MPLLETASNDFLGLFYDTLDPNNTYPHYASLKGQYKNFPVGKEGNSLYHRLGEVPLTYNIGHPMTLLGREWNNAVINVGDIFSPIGTRSQHYHGNMMVDGGGTGFLQALSPADYMVEAYKKMKPAKPRASIVNSLFELRELPGMLKGRMLSANNPLKSISNIHLAYQFGWKPIAEDIIRMLEIQTNAQKYLRQLLRDNARPIRRRIIVKDNVIENSVYDHRGYFALKPVLSTHFYRYEPKIRDRVLFRDTIWATATFMYFLPKGPRDIPYLDRLLRKMKGGSISPSVVYNAIPWSWLADWFVNLGDVLENMESGIADRLLAHRFYGMRRYSYAVERSVSAGFVRESGEHVDFHGTSVCSAFSKVREHGDPFGIGLKHENLNPMQLSILGALGISRLR